MKKCSKCGRTYDDLSLNFCLDDGTSLWSVEEEATLVRNEQPAHSSKGPASDVKVTSLNKEEKDVVSSPNSNYGFRIICLDEEGGFALGEITITASIEVELSIEDRISFPAANSHRLKVPVEGLNILVKSDSISDNQIAFVLNNSLTGPIVKTLRWDLPLDY